MSQRTALFTASALTAFVIIAIAAVLMVYPNLNSAFASNDNNVVQTPEVELLPVAEAAASPSPTPGETQLLQTLQARDDAFRAQIEQANAQLNESYNQIRLLETQNRELLQREQTYRLQLESLSQALQQWQNQSVQAATQPAADDGPVWQGDDQDDGEHDDGEHDDGEHDDGEHDDGEHDDGEHDDGEHDDGEHDDGEHDDGEHDDDHEESDDDD